MPRDPTDPNIRPLEFVGVSEADCQDRSGDLSTKIDGVQKTLNTFLAKLQGKKEGIAAVFQWVKWLVIIGGAIAGLFAAVNHMEDRALAIAKANGYHQAQPSPTVTNPTPSGSVGAADH